MIQYRRRNRDARSEGNMAFFLFFFVCLGAFRTFAWSPESDIKWFWEEQYDEMVRELPTRTSPRRSEYILDEQALFMPGDRDPLDVVLRRTEALLSHLGISLPNDLHDGYESSLTELKANANDVPVSDSATRKQLYFDVCSLRRKLALSNPLLDFDKVLFVSRDSDDQRNIMRNSNENPRIGGGVYVVSDLGSDQPKLRNLLESSVVQGGDHDGKLLTEMPMGGFQGPDLSFDAKEVVFAYRTKSNSKSGFCIYKVDIDGANLRQLTTYEDKWNSPLIYCDDTLINDNSPFFIPGGRIGFISERRQINLRCGPLVPTGTMFSMNADGSDIIPISFHETDDLYPSIDNNGMIVYTRWDYVDRTYNDAHHIWTCYPDGTDPRAPHGNYPHQYGSRPWSEQLIRAIPGSSTKYIAVAAGHHTAPVGVLVMIDVSIPDDDRMSQVKVITATGWEAQWPRDGYVSGQSWSCPWPLDHDFYLASRKILSGYKNNAVDHGIPELSSGIFLIDRFGNRSLLYDARGKIDLPLEDPIPVRVRDMPISHPVRTFQGERSGLPDHKRATLGVVNVMNADFEWPENTTIKALRIIQLIPRTWTNPNRTNPITGYAGWGNARAVLGTVPVEEDGSAYFEAPVNAALIFQALDENMMSVKSMLSNAYVHPGEQLTCAGCHEDKWSAIPSSTTPLAFQRHPSPITPEHEEAIPISYMRLVYPIFKEKCLACHIEKNVTPDYFSPPSDEIIEKAERWKTLINFSYFNLAPYVSYIGQGNGAGNVIDKGERHFTRSPVNYGARSAKLMSYLDTSHYGVTLTPEERHRITLWLDCNSPLFGAYQKAAEQLRGEKVYPINSWEMDPANLTRTEKDRPLPGSVTTRYGWGSSGNERQKRVRHIERKGRYLIIDNPGAMPCEFIIMDMRGRSILRFGIDASTKLDPREHGIAHGMYRVVLKNADWTETMPVLLTH